MTKPFTWKFLILSLCSTVICKSYTRIGSRNLKDIKLLTTTKEIIILRWEGGFTNLCHIGWFSIIPSFRNLGDFPSFRLLGFRGIFHRSVFKDFRGFSAILRFCLLGFGIISRHSVIPPFHCSAVPPFHHSSFRLLGSPFISQCDWWSMALSSQHFCDKMSILW